MPTSQFALTNPQIRTPISPQTDLACVLASFLHRLVHYCVLGRNLTPDIKTLSTVEGCQNVFLHNFYIPLYEARGPHRPLAIQ